MAFFLTCLKYSDPSRAAPETLDAWRALFSLRLDALLPWLPLTLLLGCAVMLSPLRVPKLGRTFSRFTDALLFLGVAMGYFCGLSRRLPEYLLVASLWYVGIALAYHMRTVKR
jgi:hypothetical protein